MTIAKIKIKKNYLKLIVIYLLPFLGITYRIKEKLENKFF